MQESTKEKIQYLERRGWKRIEPRLDLNHLMYLGLGEIVDSTGQCAAELLEEMKTNPFGWFSGKSKRARQDLVEKLCPLSVLPPDPVDVPRIDAQFPPVDGYSSVDRAFELLSITIVNMACRKLLGTPTYLGQQIEDTVLVHDRPENFDWNENDIVGDLVAQWPQAHLRLTKQLQWQSGGTAIVQNWELYSLQLRKIATAAIASIGLEISGSSYQVGKLCPEYSLEQFPEYVREVSDKLKFYLSDRQLPDRYNILIQGPPGTGKTRWAQSFASEVLSPQGYLVAVLDYESLENFQLPDYVDKVCVILNDADNLCLDRENSEPGTTEKILAWLDGSRAGFIQPLYLPSRSSIVTIMTANSTERWDVAGLRKGRIHSNFVFDRVLTD
jgi:hypothetical protein